MLWFIYGLQNFILPPRAPSGLPCDLPTSSNGGKSFPCSPLIARRPADHSPRKLSNFHNGRMAPQVAGAKWWEPPHKCAPPSVGGAHTDGTTAHEHQRPLRPLFGTLARGAPVRPRSRSPSPGHFCFVVVPGCFFNSIRTGPFTTSDSPGDMHHHNGQFPGTCSVPALLSQERPPRQQKS